jgi:pyruvate/2-oxoglutarate/acetoin dehydrogenase E1 component
MRIIDKFTNYFCKKIKPGTVIFGQNITTGSRISGLTNKVENIKNIKILNTQNSEASLIGFGFGLMISKVNSVYFAKQLDFIILGLDHIVNTLNSVLLQKIQSSFSIITYIVDSGYEGPQSRFHCLSDISSMSKANCCYLIFPDDIKINLKKINKKGLNIFCLSQKFSKQTNCPKVIYADKSGDFFKYNNGKKYTLIAMGFSAYEVYELIQKNIKFKDSDLFVITNPSFIKAEKILNSANKTRNVYLFDDSRSENKNLNELEILLRKQSKKIAIKKFYRKENIESLYPNSDNYLAEFDVNKS